MRIFLCLEKGAKFGILLGKKGVCLMKKLASFCLASVMAMSAAYAAPATEAAVVQRSPVGRRVMVREYQPYSVESAKGWYLGGRLGLSFLNFTASNDVTADGVSVDVIGDYDFSFETVFGGSVFAGTDFQLGNEWFRGDFEFGLIGQVDNTDAGTEIKLTVPYLMANGYYDFNNGLYVGAGLGLALPKAELGGYDLDGGEPKKIGVSPMLAMMFGWSYDLDARLTLDLRYRLAGFWGPEIERTMDGGAYVEVNTDFGFVLENSLSMGLRYRF